MGTDGCYANDESSFPDVSANGRYVVYMSKATNLVVPDGNGAPAGHLPEGHGHRRHDRSST